MALDSAAQVAAISRLLGYEGTPGDLISQGAGPFFHYTDYGAFASIVMKSDLWLTDIRFSNDAEELEHGWRPIKRAVKAQCTRGATSAVRTLANDVAADFEAAAKAADKAPDPVYVCCFCEKQDLLSQWRGYAANGGGVAIEIEPQAFGYMAGADCPIGVMRFWRVFYKAGRKRDKVRQVLDFSGVQPDPPELRAQSAAATLRFFLPTPGPTCQVPPKFRTARGLLVPYFELTELIKSFASPERLGIERVCIGPGPYEDVNARSARLLLDSHGFPGAEVIRSAIPYRA
jgi:hypothetical protein